MLTVFQEWVGAVLIAVSLGGTDDALLAGRVIPFKTMADCTEWLLTQGPGDFNLSPGDGLPPLKFRFRCLPVEKVL